MATNTLKCRDKNHFKTTERFRRWDMKWHDNKPYCRDCYERLFGTSQVRKNIFTVLKRIFDLGDFATIPLYIDHQIDKYINEYGFTEQGIYNTLCYIYFEYDFNEMNIKYGIFPVLQEYELHHNFQFDTNVQIKEQTVKQVNTNVKPSNSNVVKKIEKLELN